MREEPGYAEYEARMRQTLERLDERSDEDIGMLRPFRIFLLGLIGFLDIKDLERAEASGDQTQPATTVNLPHLQPDHRRRMHASPTPTATERATSERAPSPHLPAPENDRSASPEPPEVPSSPPAYDEAGERIPQCPSRPRNTQDPRTVWIGDRTYYPGGANNYVRDAANVDGYAFVHVSKSCIVSDTRGIHPEDIETYTKLGGNLFSYYWPGRIQQADEFALPISRTSATNYRMRYREMCFYRKDVEILIHRVTDLLTQRQKGECCSQYIYLYQTKTQIGSQTLIRVRLDRAYVLMRIAPVWNPYLRPLEASFLRSAYYILQDGGHKFYADHIDRVLRTPSWDDWEIRELLCLGMFETEDRESDALQYFAQVDEAHWAFHESEAGAPRTYCGTIIYMQTDPEDTDDSDFDMSDAPTMPGQPEPIPTHDSAAPNGRTDRSARTSEAHTRRSNPERPSVW